MKIVIDQEIKINRINYLGKNEMATKKKIKALSASKSILSFSKAHLAPELPERTVILGYYSVCEHFHLEVMRQFRFLQPHLQKEKAYSAEDFFGYSWGGLSEKEKWEVELCFIDMTFEPNPSIKVAPNLNRHRECKISFMLADS